VDLALLGFRFRLYGYWFFLFFLTKRIVALVLFLLFSRYYSNRVRNVF
jgi:hypothetical protein